MKTNMLCLAFLAMLFLNCKNNPAPEKSNATFSLTQINVAEDDLLGEYALKPNGKAEIRISKSNGDFVAEILDNRKWSTPKKIVKTNNEKLAFIFGKQMVQHVESGLTSEDAAFGIFKVDDEFEVAGDKINSEYMAILLFPVQVFKL